MLRQMAGFFTSAFSFPGLSWTLVLLAIAIGVFFGAIWLTPYCPPMTKKRGFFAVGIVSAFLTWTAIAFI